MTRRRRIFNLALGLVWLPSLGAAADSRPWDREVHVQVSPAGKAVFVATLTEVATKAGLVRTPAVPGLKELKGREVIFYSFGRNPKEMLLTITDILKEEELVVRAYLDPEVACAVEQVLEETLYRSAPDPGIKVQSVMARK